MSDFTLHTYNTSAQDFAAHFSNTGVRTDDIKKAFSLIATPSDISGGKELIALCAGAVVCAPFLYMKNPPRPKSWIMQMITINALYLQLMMII